MAVTDLSTCPRCWKRVEVLYEVWIYGRRAVPHKVCMKCADKMLGKKGGE